MAPIKKEYLEQLVTFIEMVDKSERNHNCPFYSDYLFMKLVCKETCGTIFPTTINPIDGYVRCPCVVFDVNFVATRCRLLLEEQYYNKGQ